MAFAKLTAKKATALTPQVVTIIVDDSGSMEGQKAQDATKGVQDVVITIQAGNQGSSGSRFLVSVAKFGSSTIPMVEAVRPETISMNQLSFSADSGSTEMADALDWAARAVQKGIDDCRRLTGFVEEGAPTPLVLFFSDGANTGRDVTSAAQVLKGIRFAGSGIDVVAVGIGMDQDAFPVMQQIASKPELAINIDPAQLAAFLADVGATVMKGENIKTMVDNY